MDHGPASTVTLIDVAHSDADSTKIGEERGAGSLADEYVRLVLLGAAAWGAGYWLLQASHDPMSIVWSGLNLVVVALCVTGAGVSVGRIAFETVVLACSAWMVFVMRLTPSVEPLAWFSPSFIVGSLVALLVRDAWRMVFGQRRVWKPSLKAVVGWTIVVALFTYMIVAPAIFGVLESFRERPSSYTIEELTWAETLRIRSAKFAVFAIFTYVGASVGSFLNVVAHSLPRRESIAFRSSACPKCHHPIRRIDNLPIFSYLNLRGRCRDCGVSIPIRYFGVELVAAGIFAALFLFELVTGAANVPGFRHHHATGILWIILYTKWDVVGIYLYHVSLFSVILTYCVAELDRRRMPVWFDWLAIGIFTALPVAIPDLQPVSLVDYLPGVEVSFEESHGMRLLTCVVGGEVGFAIGRMMLPLIRKANRKRSSFAISMSLLGIALGWQAVVSITVLLGLFAVVCACVLRLSRVRMRLSLTALLLGTALAHHAAWRWIMFSVW